MAFILEKMTLKKSNATAVKFAGLEPPQLKLLVVTNKRNERLIP